MTIVNLLCLSFYFLLGVSLWQLEWAGISPLVLVLMTVAGIFIADLISGVLHVFLDYYPLNLAAGLDRLYFFKGSRSAKDFHDLKQEVFAQSSAIDKISYNFKIHHLKPKHMNRKGYARQMLDTVFPACALAAIAMALPGPLALCAIIVAFFVAHTQFIHACIHDTDKSVFWKKVVRALQRIHIIYSFKTHMEHHRYGQTNFCLITGWGNVLLNPVCRALFRYNILSKDYWDKLLKRA